MWKPIALGLVELLAPQRCPGCDLAWPDTRGGAMCPSCLPLLEPAPAALVPPQAAAAAYLFQGPLADAIRRFKYHGRSDLADGLGSLLAERCRPYVGVVTCVVPMPLHPHKLQRRGYNPSALLARHVARALDAELDCSHLRRVRDTPPQAGLDREARADNVRGAFTAPRASREPVLLIDDVRTTGATAAAAAAALRDAGHEVYTLALAWAAQAAGDRGAAASL